MEEETIAAIATPLGESGIGIVRVSGPLAEPIARRLFKPKKEQALFVSHHFHYGEIIDPATGRPVDEVLIVVMKSPATYTREDILEIHCHGGCFVLQKILELVLKHGARMAYPGEFTKRAFLRGRIDLTQAEAVIDLIRAKTVAGLEIAHQQLRGWLFREVTELKDCLIEHLALIEANIDFSEEEVESIPLGKMKHDLEGMVSKLQGWVNSYDEGKILREGISCAIIGKANVGKSSLLNVLLREDRAIVTPVPGTTRDVIEEILNIRGVPVRLMDTAGLRKATDSIEREGMRRTKERVGESDFILLMLDGSEPLDADDLDILEEVKAKRKVVAVNKGDLPPRTSIEKVKILFQGDPIVSISCLTGKGVDDLRDAIHHFLIHREAGTPADRMVIANLRHKMALVQAKDSLLRAMSEVEDAASLEFIAFEIRLALEALQEVVGETTTDEILDRIFEQFCIGK